MANHHDESVVEQLMSEWNSLRVTEAYRRVHFTLLRDEALARWQENDPHEENATHFVERRLARGESALAEIRELEDRSDRSYTLCRADMIDLPLLSQKDQKKTFAKIQDVASRAMRGEIRYRTTLLGTLHHEVNELTAFIDENLG